MDRRTLGQMVVVGVIASAIGIALGLWIDWFPAQASTQAKEIDTLWDVLIIASVPVFVLVMVVVGTAIIKFRQRPGEELKDGPPTHGNTRLEVIWTALPAIIIVGLVIYAWQVLETIDEKPSSEMVVVVTGQQFTWTFEYPQPGGKPVRTNQLYVPQGQSIEFKIKSVDVIHDFWVPAFRIKMDAVPGITGSYRITPTRTGDYAIVCAELCGLGHSTMRQTAHVLSRERFDAWMVAQQKGAAS